MAIVPDLDLARIRAYCARRVPAQYLSEVRVEATMRGRSVTIFECRPPWDGSPTEWSRVPVAQLRFDPAAGRWTLHWSDRNGRWHVYEDIERGTVTDLLAEIDRDPTSIFWG